MKIFILVYLSLSNIHKITNPDADTIWALLYHYRLKLIPLNKGIMWIMWMGKQQLFSILCWIGKATTGGKDCGVSGWLTGFL